MSPLCPVCRTAVVRYPRRERFCLACQERWSASPECARVHAAVREGRHSQALTESALADFVTRARAENSAPHAP